MASSMILALLAICFTVVLAQPFPSASFVFLDVETNYAISMPVATSGFGVYPFNISDPHQQWVLISSPYNTYYIFNAITGTFIQSPDAYSVFARSFTTSGRIMEWNFEINSNSTYYVQHVASGLYLQQFNNNGVWLKPLQNNSYAEWVIKWV